MREALARPPTDWGEIYLTINASGLNDPRFHADRFMEQPVSAIRAAYRWAEQRREDEIAERSYSTAFLAQLVSQIGSMGKSSATIETFLPYPLPQRPDGMPRLTADEARTMQMLIKKRQVPMSIVTLLLEEIKRAERF